jgi:hypothetical protein
MAIGIARSCVSINHTFFINRPKHMGIASRDHRINCHLSTGINWNDTENLLKTLANAIQEKNA